MSKPDVTRLGCATVYAVLYVVAVVCAGAKGGMAFVLPVILGFPWSLLLALPLLVLQIPTQPTPLMVLTLLVVPPAINVFLILRTRGIVHAPRESRPETHHSLEDG